jgi:hypothetical protein
VSRFRAWLAARSGREKSLAVLVALTFAVLAVEHLLLAPQRERGRTLDHELKLARERADRLRALQPAGRSDASAQVLQARRSAAQARIDQAQADLIAPRDMAQQLGVLLARHPQLRVVALRSLAPQTLESGNAGAALWEHRLQLEIEGPYLELLPYLDALDRAPRRIYWRALRLQVPADGAPLTRLEIATLSREATWLQL